MDMKTKKILVSLGIILIGIGLVLSAVCILKNTYFSFKTLASRGIAACQKLSGSTLSYGGGKSVTVQHPYCKIDTWGKAELINTFDANSLKTIKSGDLIVRVINLNDYFKEGNPLVMEIDAEVASNSKIISALARLGNVGGNGTVVKLKKPTGYVSICGEVKLPSLGENNFLVTPMGQMERTYGSSQASFCSRIFNTEAMPFMGIAFIQSTENDMAMKLYIPPEENQGVNVPVDDFINYHDSFLPFDKAYFNINH